MTNISDKTDHARRAARVLAPAKVNLYLHVTGRRADGFHRLDSLVAFVDIGDVIQVRGVAGEPGITIERDGPFAAALPSQSRDDLAYQAAERFLDAVGLSGQGVAIQLSKNLPVAAGIGGGSTDAAATLRVLEAVTGLDLEARQRDDLALSLGADLPVCLAGTPTIMRGIGEILTPVGALPPLGVVLVNPRVPLSTPEVFARYAKQQPRYRGDLAIEVSQFGDRGPLIEFLRETGNDLAAAATAVQPAIGEMLSALQRNSNCLLARMSGSGATCFGLFTDAAQAITAADGLSAKHGQWWCESGRLLSQAPDVIAA